jgi:membrane protein
MAGKSKVPETAESAGDGHPPEAPTEMGGGSWWSVLKRTAKEFKADNLTVWAAALTYFGVLAIFPALLALISILGLLGSGSTQSLIDNLGGVAPGPAKDIITAAIQNLQKSQGSAGIFFIIGLAVALWSASGYVAAFMRASNAIYDIEEGRPVWKTVPVRLGVTLVLVVLLAVTAVAVVFTGGLADQAGKLLGIESTAVTVWDIVKWPVLLLIVSLMISILYWASPNVKQPGFRWITPAASSPSSCGSLRRRHSPSTS